MKKVRHAEKEDRKEKEESLENTKGRTRRRNEGYKSKKDEKNRSRKSVRYKGEWEKTNASLSDQSSYYSSCPTQRTAGYSGI
jgi:hypothetical protein